jgi:hypothetical protein
MTCILVVIRSDLHRDTAYTEGGLLWVSTVPPGKDQDITLNPATSTSFYILSDSKPCNNSTLAQ